MSCIHVCEAVRCCRGHDESWWSASSVEQTGCFWSALMLGHLTRVLPRQLFDRSGIWPKQIGVHMLLDGVTVLYVGRFCEYRSTGGVCSGWHLLYGSLYFMWLRTLTEHWNKYYLCLQAGFNFLQNHSKLNLPGLSACVYQSLCQLHTT